MSDDAWLDALAGRETPPSASQREAAVLRSALRATEPEAAAAENVISLPDRARADALVERARGEGLLARAVPRRWHWPVAAGIVLLFTAGIVTQWLPRDSIEVVRGQEGDIVRMTHADPLKFKNQLLQELRTAGVDATGYEALDVHGIDADLALPVTAAVKKVLDAHDIPVPADGVLRIEIRSPP